MFKSILVPVLFQFLENSEPTVHLYRVLELEAEEDASAHEQALVKAFKEDGIFDLLKGYSITIKTNFSW